MPKVRYGHYSYFGSLFGMSSHFSNLQFFQQSKLCRHLSYRFWENFQREEFSYTVGRKNGVIEILVNINQLFVAKIAH